MVMKSPTNAAVEISAAALTTPPSHIHPRAKGSWLRVPLAWIERSRQRRALAELDDRLLRDIGLTRAEARVEATQPFWR